MSAFKKLDRKDVFTTVHLAKKSWSISGSDASILGIGFRRGTSGSINQYPGDPNYNELLNYRSVRQLFYSNFVSGSELPTGSFENFLQSSFFSSSRILGEDLGIVSFPKTVFGVSLVPGSLSFNLERSYIVDEEDYVLETIEAGGQYIEDLQGGAVSDDGEGNLISNENDFLGRNRGDYIGDVVYTQGLGIFTDPQFGPYFSNLSNPVMSWKSYYPVYTTSFTCKVRDEEFNFSLNPTSRKDIFGNIADNLLVEEFKPYITAIGLYNEAGELLAVGKLGQPIPKSNDTDMTFQIKLDI